MPPHGVRRSGRIPKEIAILLIGSDPEGKLFSEETKTVVLSRHGAGIVCTHRLGAEQELILRRLDTNKETEIRLVGQLGSQSGRHTYGVAFVDPNLDFWGIEFPPPTESDRSATRFVLECIICKSREVVDHSEIELDVYAINEGILRNCKSCQNPTLWRRVAGDVERQPAPSEAEREPHPPVPEPPVLPPVAELPAPRKNRRAHVRTKVNFEACVRRPGFEEDIVVCENISRGGLCFKSRKRYFETAMVEVAAPYEPGTAAIFVPAQVVHVEELADEKLFRCGLAFMISRHGRPA